MTLDCTCNRLKEAEAKAAKWDALVRCVECKHLLAVPRGYECPVFMSPVWPGGYCFWGERRES